MPWILNEDAAMKRRLTGLVVSHQDGVIPVPVRFTTPEIESPDMAYPSITITRLQASRAPEREHRGFVKIDYGPEGADLPGPEDRWGWYAEFPIPYNIDYQIEVHTRLQQQQVELAQLLAKEDRLPERGGYLEIPNVDVVASMDVIGGPVFTDGYDDDSKRYFEIRYIVRVFSEMTPWDIKRYNFPDQVVGRIYNRARTRQLGGFENQYTP